MLWHLFIQLFRKLKNYLRPSLKHSCHQWTEIVWVVGEDMYMLCKTAISLILLSRMMMNLSLHGFLYLPYMRFMLMLSGAEHQLKLQRGSWRGGWIDWYVLKVCLLAFLYLVMVRPLELPEHSCGAFFLVKKLNGVAWLRSW